MKTMIRIEETATARNAGTIVARGEDDGVEIARATWGEEVRQDRAYIAVVDAIQAQPQFARDGFILVQRYGDEDEHITYRSTTESMDFFAAAMGA